MDERGTVTMSRKELNRVLERRLTQAKAAEQLGLSLRQVERPRRGSATPWRCSRAEARH